MLNPGPIASLLMTKIPKPLLMERSILPDCNHLHLTELSVRLRMPIRLRPCQGMSLSQAGTRLPMQPVTCQDIKMICFVFMVVFLGGLPNIYQTFVK